MESLGECAEALQFHLEQDVLPTLPGKILNEQMNHFLRCFNAFMGVSLNRQLWYVLLHSSKGHLALLHPEHLLQYIKLLMMAEVKAFAFYLVPKTSSTQLFYTHPCTPQLQARPYANKILAFSMPLYGFYFRNEDLAGLYGWRPLESFNVYSDIYHELEYGDPCPYLMSRHLLQDFEKQIESTLRSFVPSGHNSTGNQPMILEGKAHTETGEVNRVAFLMVVNEGEDTLLTFEDNEGKVEHKCCGKAMVALAFNLVDSFVLKQPNHKQLSRPLNPSSLTISYSFQA